MIYDNFNKILDLVLSEDFNIKNKEEFDKYLDTYIILIALYGDATIRKEDVENFTQKSIQTNEEDAKKVVDLINATIKELNNFDEEGNFIVTKDRNIDMFFCSFLAIEILKMIEEEKSEYKIFFWLSNDRDHVSFVHKNKSVHLIQIACGLISTDLDFADIALLDDNFNFGIEELNNIFIKLNELFQDDKKDEENFNLVTKFIFGIIKKKVISNIKFQIDDDGNAFFKNGIYVNIPEVVVSDDRVEAKIVKYRNTVNENGELKLIPVEEDKNSQEEE